MAVTGPSSGHGAGTGAHRQRREWFDHWCRTPGKEDGVATYIRNNPVMAGLVPRTADWPWVR